MKKIIALLLVCFMFACEKNEPQPISNQVTEQEIFNAILGTWQPNKIGYDVNFTKTMQIRDSSWLENRLIFSADSMMSVQERPTLELRSRKFHVEIGGIGLADTTKKIWFSLDIGIEMAPGAGQSGGITLNRYTDSTLVFMRKGGDIYTEYKRVK